MQFNGFTHRDNDELSTRRLTFLRASSAFPWNVSTCSDRTEPTDANGNGKKSASLSQQSSGGPGEHWGEHVAPSISEGQTGGHVG